MKKNSRLSQSKQLKVLYLSVLFMLLIENSASARVSSISGNKTIVINDQQYDSVSIDCRTKRDRPMLLKQKGTKQWCDSSVEDVCYTEKIKAAKFVCSQVYSRLLKDNINTATASQEENSQTDKKPIANVEDLRIGLREIEDALLDIQQKRLMLRRKELALQSQLTRFNSQVDSLAAE